MDAFDDIKVGEKVLVLGVLRPTRVEVVEKVNKATFSVNGQLYNKSDGWRRGSSNDCYASHVRRAEETEIDRIEKEQSISKYAAYLEKYDYTNLSLDTLIKIYKLIKDERN